MPVVSQVLVAEHGHHAAALGKHAGDLLEEVAPRIHVPAARVPRVVAVLGDEQNSVDAKPVGAGMQGAADARMDGNAMLGRTVDTDIVFQHVVDVHRHDFDVVKSVKALVRGGALEELGDDDVGVGLGVVDGADGGDAQRVAHGHLISC